MEDKVIKFEKVNKRESFLELSGMRAEEISKLWKVEMLEYRDRESDEINYAIRLTSTLNYQKVIFPKEDFEDKTQAMKIERRLRKIGNFKTNYIKTIADCVNTGLSEQPDKIISIKDINGMLLNNRVSGVAPETYYKKFIKHFKNNPHLFPKRSSNKYIHGVSEGAILDNYKLGEYKYHPVSIRTGAFKELLGMDSDNKYREVLDSLLSMGVLQGKLKFSEENAEYTLDNSGKTVINYKTPNIKARRYDKRVTMNTKKIEANVFIFNIDFEKGE